MTKKHIFMHDNQVIPEFEKSYFECINHGTEFAKKQNIAVVSIARNAAKNLSNNLQTLNQIEHLFNKCYFYIYENDSDDNTVEILQEWAISKDNVVFETEKLSTPYMPLSTSNIRTENLANARNKCLAYVKSIQDKIDMVIVIDIDFMALSMNGIKNTFGWFSNNPNIDAIAGFSFLVKQAFFPNHTKTDNEILTNYDSWAYRHTWWSDTQQVGLMYWFQWWIPLIGSPLIHVNSAFGGCATYKKDVFLLGEYSGENCEHVMFHQKIFQKKPLFNLTVNPSQIMYV